VCALGRVACFRAAFDAARLPRSQPAPALRGGPGRRADAPSTGATSPCCAGESALSGRDGLAYATRRKPVMRGRPFTRCLRGPCRVGFTVRETTGAAPPRPRLLDRVRAPLRARHYSRCCSASSAASSSPGSPRAPGHCRRTPSCALRWQGWEAARRRGHLQDRQGCGGAGAHHQGADPVAPVRKSRSTGPTRIRTWSPPGNRLQRTCRKRHTAEPKREQFCATRFEGGSDARSLRLYRSG
jgi:hypothetical protein